MNDWVCFKIVRCECDTINDNLNSSVSMMCEEDIDDVLDKNTFFANIFAIMNKIYNCDLCDDEMSKSVVATTGDGGNNSGASSPPLSNKKTPKRYLHNYGRYSSIYQHPLALWAEKWWRRAISITMIALVFVVLTALFPVLAVAALIADIVLYKKRNGFNYVRVLAFFETYLVIEFIAIISCLIIYILYMISLVVAGGDRDRSRWDRWNFWYQSWWGGVMLFGWSMRAMGLSVQIEIKGGEEDFIAPWSDANIRERVAKAIGINPKIMFLRHASFADTLVPQGILSHFFHLRYIVKQELLWDPGLDISGSRTPNFFLFRDAGAEGMDIEMEAIKNLVRDFKPKVIIVEASCIDLYGNEVTCIWPEGTRFSKSKREKVLESLKKKDDPKYEFASKLKHTLLPRVGGALALLESNTCGDVYEDIPKTRQERIDWILKNWVDIDTWVEQQQQLEKSESKKKFN
ncbi:hypothetical protein PPL_12288 [Heterostelium album PN500]|uniref:Uncharacterized protein n=1 Tax=Heterostelium pallidum (strain ATCC 26659 / Pp 5 / PN500) TaxID=670386 RepID=D3BM78_HETP5|nr:hypothetical protein PPL_12288 [Heterostelium album PN500]EFA77679.1 hypothetical protein PPL_12288 [Heterostelium album PN500]|eukprot:XP_020429807.1 hypothetical protein PPL_12288 [Heterostelium album PN500]